MKFRKLGSSDLVVSEISLGSWLTYDGGIDADLAKACVRSALNGGVNLFDTANVYGRGAAETLLGGALRGIPRDTYLLATKLYFPMGENDRGLSASQIRKQLDASLVRLKTDYVDLYQCHRFDPNVSLEETLGALSEAVRSGRVRYIGFSEWPVDKIAEAMKLPGCEQFVSSQPQYSLLWRKPEKELFPFCQQNGISQIVFSPLAQGILTGKYKSQAVLPSGVRATHPTMSAYFPKKWLVDEVLSAVSKCAEIAQEHGLELSQLALAWILRQPNVASAIVGASRECQVERNIAAAELSVSGEVLAQVGEILAPFASY